MGCLNVQEIMAFYIFVILYSNLVQQIVVPVAVILLNVGEVYVHFRWVSVGLG